MHEGEEGEGKVLDLAERAERVIDAALPVLEKAATDGSRETFALQIAREFEKMREPWPWLENRAAGAIGIGLSDIQRAHLPAAYRNAKAALREAERIDECRDWASKAEALASYARQARDEELFALAVRVRLRAIRRAGELIREINAVRGRPKLIDDGTVTNFPTRAQAATDAGMSERQKTNALRLAAVPVAEFEDAVESPRPPTLTALAAHGTQKRVVNPPSPYVVEQAHIYVDFKYSKVLGVEDIATERQVAVLMHAWRAAGEEPRRRFLEQLGRGKLN